MKSKMKKILVLIVATFVTFLIFLNYYSYNEFRLNKIIDVDDYFIEKFSNKSENLSKTSEKIKYTEPNGVGTVVCKYTVKYDNINKQIKNITYTGNNKINYRFIIYTKDNNKEKIDSDEFIKIKNGRKTVNLNKNVQKIIVNTSYDIFGSDAVQKEYGKFLVIKQLNINSVKYEQLLKKTVLLKSILTTFIIISLLIIIYFLKDIKIPKIDDLNIPKFFLVFALIYGFTFSILMPLYQVPDEETHINMTYKEMGYKDIKFNQKVNNYADASSVIRNINKRIDRDKYFDFSKKINIKLEAHIPKISIIRHLPQAIGLIISMIFNLPVFIAITLCELLTVITYSLICYKALKILPIKKHLFALIMLLPISIQQFSSFSYDAMLNCLCFLLIAYILRIKFADKEFNTKNLLMIVFISLMIAIVKLPYALLSTLTLLIPLEKYNLDFKLFKINKKNIIKNKKQIIASLVIIIPLIGFIASKILMKIAIGKVLLATIRYPRTTILSLIRTTKSHFLGYINELFGSLGWFDIKFNKWFILLTIIMLMVTIFFRTIKENRLKYKFRKADIVLLILLSLIMYYIISISMWNWTFSAYGIDSSKLSLQDLGYHMSNISVIGGIQGRYFLPLLPLLLLPISSTKIYSILQKHKFNIIYISFFIVLAIYCSYILIDRFWI